MSASKDDQAPNLVLRGALERTRTQSGPVICPASIAASDVRIGGLSIERPGADRCQKVTTRSAAAISSANPSAARTLSVWAKGRVGGGS